MSGSRLTLSDEQKPISLSRITRSSGYVEMIGMVCHQITGAKLPSNRQMLQLFFYNIRCAKFTVKESAKLTIDAALIFWRQARIPSREAHKCAQKLLKLYEDYRAIQKKIHSKYPLTKTSEFVATLDDLFDIASANALNDIKIEEDKVFLLMQREKGRRGYMTGVDMTLYRREMRSLQRKQKEESRKRQHDEMSKQSSVVLGEEDESISDKEDETTDLILDEDSVHYESPTAAKRGRKNWITPRLTAALDAGKVTDGKAVHILTAAAEALGADISELVLNHTSIHELRKKHRELGMESTQEEFMININQARGVVVHWDGKVMEEIVGRQKVERIAVLVSFDGSSKFLSAAKVQPATGVNIAAAVRDTLIKWNIIDRVSAMSFDTTSANTGPKSGATFFLQEYLDRKLIQLPCRHHIFEIVLRNVLIFEVKLGTTSAPEELLFNRFATVWDNLDHTLFRSGMKDVIVRSKISDEECDIIKKFCTQKLQQIQIRADYKELLELTLVFLGEDRGEFRTCSSTSHARFMGKAIYSLKIFIFREKFQVTARELNGLRDICVFLVQLYIKVWFGSTNALEAPNQDLNFVKNSIAYAYKDSATSEAVLLKIKNHLWYLCPETVALAFFDSDVSLDEKRKMVERLQSIEPIVKLEKGRQISHPEDICDSTLSDFVSYKTKNFFVSFGLSPNFLQCDPSTWNTNEHYLDALNCCRELLVVNDVAERGVRFMKEYNRTFTKNEEQMQLVLQFVEGYRKKYPSNKKLALI